MLILKNLTANPGQSLGRIVAAEKAPIVWTAQRHESTATTTAEHLSHVA